MTASDLSITEIFLLAGLLVLLGCNVYLTWRQATLRHRFRILLATDSDANLPEMLSEYLARVQETTSQVRGLNALSQRLQFLFQPSQFQSFKVNLPYSHGQQRLRIQLQLTRVSEWWSIMDR